MDGKTVLLDNLIEGFKVSCEVEGLSQKATEWYTSFLTRFRQFLDQNQMPTD